MNRDFIVLKPVLRLFFSGRRGMLISGALLALATALAGMALLGLSGWFITTTAIAGLTAALINVFTPAAAVRLLAIIRTAGRYGERLTTHDATLGILASLRERLFRAWATPGLALHLRLQPARLLHRLTADIDALESVYLRIVVPMLSAFGAAVLVATVLGFLNLWFGIGAGVWLVGSSLAVLLFASKIARKHARRRAYGIESIRSRAVDFVSGQVELMMSGRLAAQQDALARADRYAAEADASLNRLDTCLLAAVGLGSTGLVAVTLLVVAGLSVTGRIDAPMAALGLILVLAATDQFSALRKGALELGRTLLAARRVGPQIGAAEHDHQIAMPAAGMALVINRGSARHQGAAEQAFTDIDLAVKTGEIVALVGPSGAGKSTLLSVIAGEMDLDAGELARLRAALMTQRTELFNDTIKGNLLLARPGAGDETLHRAFADAGLAPVISSLPDGMQTMLGEGGSGLSGGQSRRLALARFFLSDAPLWLLDEPTEGLDGATARDVVTRIARRAAGHTLVIATHLRREAMIADRIVSMREGRIVECARRGTPSFEDALGRLRPD